MSYGVVYDYSASDVETGLSYILLCTCTIKNKVHWVLYYSTYVRKQEDVLPGGAFSAHIMTSFQYAVVVDVSENSDHVD
jgi:hypothetical protein